MQVVIKPSSRAPAYLRFGLSDETEGNRWISVVEPGFFVISAICILIHRVSVLWSGADSCGVRLAKVPVHVLTDFDFDTFIKHQTVKESQDGRFSYAY